MYTLGFLIVSLFVAFFAFMIYDVAQPSPDGVHKLGPVIWGTKRHGYFTESCSEVEFVDAVTGHTEFRQAEQRVYFGLYTIKTKVARVVTFQFLFWSLSFGWGTN